MKFVDLDTQMQAIDGEIRYAIDTVLSHKQFIMGPEVAKLEQQLADYCGVKHVISAASGTDALLMLLMALEIGPGDGVIVPPFTFVATAEVVKLLGATPVFVDVDEDSFNISPTELERTIEEVNASGAVNLKGIIAVDLFGMPADYSAIVAIAEKHGLFMLCDAAQSFGAHYQGTQVGNIGDISATSFFPAKPLGCYGDGGAVFTNNDDIADVVESIRFHGKGVTQYENIRIGITGRMDTIQAAILSCKLNIFDQELEAREKLANRYDVALSDCVTTPKIPHDRSSAWAVYTIRSAQRDEIKQALQAEGIPCAVYYPAPLHQQPAFENAIGGGEPMPVSDKLSLQVISLPIHPYLDENDQDKVIQAIKSVTQ